MKERIKIAVALGYYARAVGEIKTLKDAIDAYALTEYRNDVDCQVAFRKGFQEAEKHFAVDGQEGHEFRELVGWIARLDQDIHQQRQEILEYLKRQELIASTPVYMRAAAAPGSITEAQIDQAVAFELDRIAIDLGAPPRRSGIGDKLFRQSIFDFIASKPMRADAWKCGRTEKELDAMRAEPGGYSAGAVGYIGDGGYARGGGGGGGGSGELHGSGASVAHIDAVWHRGDGSGGGGGGSGGSRQDRMIAIEPDGTITEIGGGGGCLPGHGFVSVDLGSGDAIACSVGDNSDLDGPFQMRRVDTGELYCQNGKPVVHQGYRACMEACQYLYDNMGIHCAPSAGRPLGQKEWNPPVFNINLPPERQHHQFRWHARLEDELLKQKIEDPFDNQDS
jgi:hypothetical protein